MHTRAVALVLAALCYGAGAAQAEAQPPTGPASNCPVTHDQLATALKAAVKPAGGPSNGGLDNNEWAAIVNRDGNVCAVASWSCVTGQFEAGPVGACVCALPAPAP